MSLCPSGSHPGHPGCRPGGRHCLCILVELLPALASLLPRAAPQMPPAGAQGHTEPGLAQLGMCKGENWARHLHTLEPVQTSQWHKCQKCPLCQKEPRFSSSCCWDNPDPMGKTQLSPPSGPAPKVSVFCSITVAQGLGFSSVHPAVHPPNTPYVMALVFVAPTETALKLSLF